jgi:peroxiredoxin
VNTADDLVLGTAPLSIGDEAPDFTLPTHNEGELNLAWYRGRKNVLLTFYPGDWTPVCAVHIPSYQQIIHTLEGTDTQVLAVSVDSVPCHGAWARSLGGLSFPLMSDYYPHGRVARLYGVLNKRGYAERAVFLIDKEGIIRFIERVPIADVPDATPVLQLISSFSR